MREIKRVLRPRGLLAINEFKKIEGPPGPPVAIRLSPQDLKKHLQTLAFRAANTVDIGPYNYLSTFTLQSGA